MTIFENYVEEGTFERSINTEGLPKGSYFVKIEYDGKLRFEKIVVI